MTITTSIATLEIQATTHVFVLSSTRKHGGTVQQQFRTQRSTISRNKTNISRDFTNPSFTSLSVIRIMTMRLFTTIVLDHYSRGRKAGEGTIGLSCRGGRKETNAVAAVLFYPS